MQFFVLSCTFHDAEEPEIPLPTVKASMAGSKMLQRFFASQGPEAVASQRTIGGRPAPLLPQPENPGLYLPVFS